MSRNPWAAYWAKGGEGAGGARPGAGCLPEAEATIAPVLEETWRDFAAELPPRGRVIDLATGDGAVLRRLKAERPGLELIGVDSAPFLPPPPPGIQLAAGIRMEQLPYREARFDAATSQFGLEYGDVPAIASELARILKSGARLAFVIHHRSSQVVTHNRARRLALSWAARESGLMEKARRLAQARQLAVLPTPPAFRLAIDKARELYPGQPVAAEFAAAIAQALDLTRPAETIARLDLLSARSTDEIGRLEALEAAARDADGIAGLAASFAPSVISLAQPMLLEEKGGGPFAWLLSGERS